MHLKAKQFISDLTFKILYSKIKISFLASGRPVTSVSCVNIPDHRVLSSRLLLRFVVVVLWTPSTNSTDGDLRKRSSRDFLRSAAAESSQTPLLEMSHESEEDLLQRHRKEMKDLQVKAATMKKSAPVSDKKRRKEVLAEIEKLEKELDDRHNEELSSCRNNATESAGEVSADRANESDSPKDERPLSPHCTQENGKQNVSAVLLTNGDSGDRLRDDEEEPVVSGGKMTRAQRRRNVKQSRLDERLAAVKLEAEKPFEVSARTTEKIKLKKILDDLSLKLVEMRSDGNCMYHSLSHQLQLRSKSLSVQDLRRQTAEHMTSKPDEFLPFLAHHETGDPLTPQEFVAYCDDIAKTNAWGSQVELRALATILKWPILVLQSEGPEVHIGEEYISEEKPNLIIVYHRHELSLGEHYNSVVPLE